MCCQEKSFWQTLWTNADSDPFVSIPKYSVCFLDIKAEKVTVHSAISGLQFKIFDILSITNFLVHNNVFPTEL